MEHIQENDILQIGLSLIKNVGERMYYKSKLLNIYRFFNILVSFANLYFVFASFGHISGMQYIEISEGALTMVHTVAKYTSLLYHRSHIENLLNDMRTFWDYRKFPELRTSTKRFYTLIRTIQNSFIVVGTVCVTMNYMKPLFNENNRYLFECWTFSYPFVLETIILTCQYYFWYLFQIILGYDFIYFSYSAHVIIQIRLLKHRFRKMSTNAEVGELYECVKHHQMLLSIFDRMKHIYFWMLLFHYFVTLISGCVQLYVLLLGNVDEGDSIGRTIYIFGLFTQFAYYSFPAEEIVFELTDLSNAIYMSTWYERGISARRMLLLVMMKAQRQKYLSAGGIINMNLDAFGSVIRKTFSFYAVLKNIVNK